MTAEPKIKKIFHVEDTEGIAKLFQLMMLAWNKKHPEHPLEHVHFWSHGELEDYLKAHPEEVAHALIISDNDISGQPYEGSQWLLKRPDHLKSMPAIMFTSGIDNRGTQILLKGDDIPVVSKTGHQPIEELILTLEKTLGLAVGQERNGRAR